MRIVSALAHSAVLSLLRRTPLWVILYVNRRCNLDCLYCKFKDDSVKDPPLDQILHAIDKIRSLGCRFVSLTGGEPTLRRDLCQIITHCRQRGVVSYLNTNGTLLTRDYIERLCAAGVDMVNLSVDAVTRYDDSTKDIFRRRNVLRHLIDARRDYGFMLITNQVLCANNMSLAPSLIDFMNAQGVPVSFGLQYPIGDDLSKHDPTVVDNVIQRLLAARRAGHRMITSGGYLAAIKKRLQTRSTWKCDAGNSFFSIDVDGRVSICDRHRPVDVILQELSPQNYASVAIEGRKREEFRACSVQCMINCAYETSYFQHHKVRYILDFLLGIVPKVATRSRQHP